MEYTDPLNCTYLQNQRRKPEQLINIVVEPASNPYLLTKFPNVVSFFLTRDYKYDTFSIRSYRLCHKNKIQSRNLVDKSSVSLFRYGLNEPRDIDSKK